MAQRIDELSCLFVACRDGCTANAKYQRQQQWHIDISYLQMYRTNILFGVPDQGQMLEVWEGQTAE